MTEGETIVIESVLTQADWAAWQAVGAERARARVGVVRLVVVMVRPRSRAAVRAHASGREALADDATPGHHAVAPGLDDETKPAEERRAETLAFYAGYLSADPSLELPMDPEALRQEQRAAKRQ